MKSIRFSHIVRLPFLVIAGVALAVAAFAALSTTDILERNAAETKVSSAFAAAGDAAFLKVGDIKGESQDADHKNWSDIISFSQAITTPTSVDDAASRRRGSVVLEDIVVTKELDAASPKLAEAVLTGEVFPEAKIHLAKSTGERRQVYYTYELKNIRVTSYSVNGNTDDDPVAVEDITLNFEEIKVTYTELDETGKKKGSVEYTWNVEEGAK